MSYVFDGLKPELVWQYFYELNQIPRCSRNEEAARQYVIDFAKKNNFEFKEDAAGNVVVSVPASAGMENKPIVIIQGHLDMVCEKNKGTEHDFSKDPIKMFIDGEWVKADGTTLGSDNGIGVCMGLAAATDENVKHPHLELLFTIDEETGLTGATDLASDLLQGKILINLDSEEEGDLYIGCAGGMHTIMRRKINKEKIPAGFSTFKVKVSGLRGGHSGLNIGDGFGNAIKLLARFLQKLNSETEVRLVSIDGGTAHNAIPREAEAVIAVKEEGLLNKKAQEYQNIFNDELRFTEKNIVVSVADENVEELLSQDDSKSTIHLLHAIHHGVMAMSMAVPGLVETSTNMAVVETKNNEIYMLTSQRSSVGSAVIDIADKLKSQAELAGFEAEQGGGYPAWQPNPDSELVKLCKEVYTKRFGQEPAVKAIHAGLECGIIGDKYEGMDMISFGPDILGAHSPDERVKHQSVANTWEFLKAVLEAV